MSEKNPPDLNAAAQYSVKNYFKDLIFTSLL